MGDLHQNHQGNMSKWQVPRQHFIWSGAEITSYNAIVSFSVTWSLFSWGQLYMFSSVQFSSVQSLSCVWLYVTPWTAAHQASLSITNSQSLPILVSIELVMPSSHLILCHPLLLLPPNPSQHDWHMSESTLRMRWPKYWSFGFSISPSNEHPGLISFRMD